MAEQHGYETSSPTPMDYREHEKTYAFFLTIFKLGTIWVIAILLGMMVALMTSAGFLAGFLTFLLFGVIVTYLAK